MLDHSFVRSFIPVSCLQQCTYHLLVVERLDYKVGCTFLDARYGKLYVCISGEEHNFGLRTKALDFSKPIQSLVSRIDATRKVHVEQHHVGMFLSQFGRDRVRVGYGDDIGEYGFKQHSHRSENVAVVVNNKYSSLFLYHDNKATKKHRNKVAIVK